MLDRMPATLRRRPHRTGLRPSLRALLVALALAVSPTACAVLRGGPAHSPIDGPLADRATFGQTAPGRINLKEATDRPRATVVVRDGDPEAAVALIVWTDGDELASAGLAAIVRARLLAKGFPNVDVRPTRDAYRVRGLVPTASDASSFVGALKAALLEPIRAASAELADAKQAFESLRRRPLDGPALLPIARCTGEPGPLPSTHWYDPQTASGAAKLEKARAAHHGSQRVAIAVVGPTAIGKAVDEALDGGGPWPSVAPPDDAWPAGDSADVHALSGAQDPAPRLTVAVRVADAFAAAAIADRASTGGGPLLARLAAVPSWRVASISATVRPRGACLAVTMLRDPARKSAAVATDAASLATIITKEVEAEIAEARPDPSVAGRQVLLASDPRNAAAAAAWWSLARRLPGAANRRFIALGVPADELVSSTSPEDLSRKLAETRASFSDALAKSRAAWSRHAVDAVTRVESGQGELWVLLASPCGNMTESESDAGITALAAVAAAHHVRSDVMVVEPWIAQDGVGILVHGSDRSGDGPRALAVRAASAAARAMTLRTLPSGSVDEARRRLVSLIDAPESEHGAAFGLLAKTLLRERAALLAPFGLHQSLVERDAQSASLRWAAIADGPVRIAVAANEDKAQATAAVLAADRWFAHDTTPRICPPVPSPIAPAREAPRDVTLHTTEQPPRALIGISVNSPTPAQLTMLRLVGEALRGPDGWLAGAFSSFPGACRQDVHVRGGPKSAALIIDVRSADASLDDAVDRVKAMLDRVAKSGPSPRDLERARDADAARRAEASLDPRHRIAALWRGETGETRNVTLETWRAWLPQTLAETRIAVVRVRPPHEPDKPKEPITR